MACPARAYLGFLVTKQLGISLLPLGFGYLQGYPPPLSPFHQFILHPWQLIGTHLHSWALLLEMPIGTNAGSHLNPGFYISLFISCFGIISQFFLEHSIIKLYTNGANLNFLLKLSDLKSDFIPTLGYHNPALNDPAQVGERHCESKVFWT